MESGVFIKYLVVAFYGDSIVAVNEFKYLYFDGLYVGGAPKMHNISGLSRVGYLDFGR